MAENHPIAFRFVMQAKEKGATVIHADPRFTRTSALADMYVPLRAGTDIAFLGGIIRHILENDLWFRDYALDYTNIATIIDSRFTDAGTGNGRFSGWSEEKQQYQFDSWQYEGMVVPSALSEHYLNTAESFSSMSHRLEETPPPQDRTLQHPNCVYQIMRRQYAGYTPEAVAKVTGCPAQMVIDVANALAEASGREKTGAICYAVGWTHHSTGVQMIRSAAIIQALLGNTGRPGGGVLALRGHCSIQGSTDIPTLYNMLPSYLPQPNAFRPESSGITEFLKYETMPTGWWHNFPKYIVSLLRAWYGKSASEQNEWGFQWLPKIVGDHSQLPMTVAIQDGLIRGLFILGQNPVVGGSNSRLVQKGLGKLEWLVIRDFAETDTASFWYKGHAIRDGELCPEDIGTEIFLMPTALAGEKAGTFTNTHRLVQWHDKIVDAPGDSRSELWFVYHLAQRLQKLYADSTRRRDDPIRNLTLDYPISGERQDPDPEAVLKEINGYTWPDREQIPSFLNLAADGSTACGSWLYCGVFPSDNENKARSRKADGPDGPGTHLSWAFAWPANRRTLYNRASADPNGEPWSEAKKLVWWDTEERTWQGTDAIDYIPHKAPDFTPDWSQRQSGMDAIRGDAPYIMMPDGRAALFVTSGLKDGPLPTHYEPVESPVANALHGQQCNPVAKVWHRPDNPIQSVGNASFPHVLTTYRLTEHHSGGTPTRLVPHTAELQPEGFAEIPPELAHDLGVRNLDWIVISTLRGEIETKALVTARLRPFYLDGRRVYQVGMPWHFGWQGLATGDIANVLTAIVQDPNTGMHENKALTCALRKGRLDRTPPDSRGKAST